MITVGSAANGLVSIAVTKIATGVVPNLGERLYGRVLNAVHKPEFTRFVSTCSRVNSESDELS